MSNERQPDQPEMRCNIILIDNADEPAAQEVLLSLSTDFTDEQKVNAADIKGAYGFVKFIELLKTDPLSWGERQRMVFCSDGVPTCLRSIGRYAKHAEMSPEDYVIYQLTRISKGVTLIVIAPTLGKSPLLMAIRTLAEVGKAQIILPSNGGKPVKKAKRRTPVVPKELSKIAQMEAQERMGIPQVFEFE